MDAEDTECPSCQDDVPWETVEIRLSEQETRFARQFLNRVTADPDAGEIPLTKSALFSSCAGLEADIKLCNGDSPYVDPVLFMDGNEIEALPAGDELEGTYDFRLDGKIYRVEIIAADIPPENGYTDLGPEAVLPWHKGFGSDEEMFQINSTKGWEVAHIKIDPLPQVGEFVLKAVNSYDKLVAALHWIAEHDKEFGSVEDHERMIVEMTRKAQETLNEIQA